MKLLTVLILSAILVGCGTEGESNEIESLADSKISLPYILTVEDVIDAAPGSLTATSNFKDFFDANIEIIDKVVSISIEDGFSVEIDLDDFETFRDNHSNPVLVYRDGNRFANMQLGEYNENHFQMTITIGGSNYSLEKGKK